LDYDSVLDSEYFFIYKTRCSNFILCDDKSDRPELQSSSNSLLHSTSPVLIERHYLAW